MNEHIADKIYFTRYKIDQYNTSLIVSLKKLFLKLDVVVVNVNLYRSSVKTNVELSLFGNIKHILE